MREVKSYDLVVLGGGPAGITAAATAAAYGRSVALIDNHYELGGAGINTGTVPSKTLRETALTLSGARSRKLYGVDLSLRRDATVSDFLRHERAVKASMNSMLAGYLAASNADLHRGTGAFEDAHTIRVREDGALMRGAYVLVATGSSPMRPGIFPFDSPGVYDSDTILNLDRLPRSLIVIGAGTIGCEYACIFAALNCHVEIVDSRSSILPFLDSEISTCLKAAMNRTGIVFHSNERVDSCRATQDAGIAMTLSSGATLCAEAALIAAGRKSNTANLNLAAAAVTTGKRGLIEVDQHYRTEALHVYAAGDVIGPPALASTSMEQARHATRHAFGRPVSDVSGLLPTGIYTIPEIGMVGQTEDALRQNGVEYCVGRAYYDGNARGKVIGDKDGMLKLLFRRPDLKLAGVHAIGEQATELVHVGMMAMLSHSTAELFDEACFNLPTLGQLYKTAALDAIACSGNPSKS